MRIVSNSKYSASVVATVCVAGWARNVDPIVRNIVFPDKKELYTRLYRLLTHTAGDASIDFPLSAVETEF